MRAIREIQTVEQGKIMLSLPPTFWGQQVEIIILPVQQHDQKPSQKKSLRGCLRQYAKPELIATEADAWLEAVADISHPKEKHEPR